MKICWRWKRARTENEGLHIIPAAVRVVVQEEGKKGNRGKKRLTSRQQVLDEAAGMLVSRDTDVWQHVRQQGWGHVMWRREL